MKYFCMTSLLNWGADITDGDFNKAASSSFSAPSIRLGEEKQISFPPCFTNFCSKSKVGLFKVSIIGGSTTTE